MIEIIIDVEKENTAKVINKTINEKNKIKITLIGKKEEKLFKTYNYLKKCGLNVKLHPNSTLLKNLPF